MSYRTLGIGKKGESLAHSFLKRQGYRIIEKNFKTRLGELDIIADDNGCISFIEVRSRSDAKFGLAGESIDRRKQNRISKTALAYIKARQLEDKECRFDIVCIDGIDSAFPKISLIKNAFELAGWYRY